MRARSSASTCSFTRRSISARIAVSWRWRSVSALAAAAREAPSSCWRCSATAAASTLLRPEISDRRFPKFHVFGPGLGEPP